jgi:hypothetical protein
MPQAIRNSKTWIRGYDAACDIVFMNEMLRSKKGLGDLFNEVNRKRVGWEWKRPKRRLRAFRQLGVEESWARRFAYSRKGGWAIACSPIMYE